MSVNAGHCKKPEIKVNGEEVEDQLDRLNFVIQDFIQNIDMSRSFYPSVNASESIFQSIPDNPDTDSEALSENIEKKIEEILQENDRLRMIIEDFVANSERQVCEIGCTAEEIQSILIDLRSILIGKKQDFNLKLGHFNIKIHIICKPLPIFPMKNVISSSWAKETIDLENDNLDELVCKLFRENEHLKDINKKLTFEDDMIKDMKSVFLIKCCDPIEEEFHSIEFPLSVIKEAALEIEVKKYKDKNKILDQAQEEINWQLNDVKSLKQTFLNKIQEANEYRQSLEKKCQEIKEAAANIHKQGKIKGKPPKGEKRRNTLNASKEKSKIIEELNTINTQMIEDLDRTLDTPFIPVPTYKYFTLDALNEQLKYLEEKAQTSSDPQKFLREIERCKTQITNLRGEQAIYDCKQKTRNMFKIVKHIEKSVKSENSKRNNLIKELIRDSNCSSDHSQILKKEIEESLDVSLKRLEDKKLVQKRTAVVFKKNFYEDQEESLRELRTQINVLTKHDNIMQKSLQQKKAALVNKEIELQEKEKFLMDHWKKNYSSKDIIETVQKISKKLAQQKEALDKDKEKSEHEKIQISKKKLENEIEKGKLKNMAQQLDEERKFIMFEKTEIEKFLKQVSSLPSYLSNVKFHLPVLRGVN
ncbi:hypothetical protein SteCoe_17434 [Stentor coeruleus]|uniref:Uncharacterized protein n=1 Tax=Stentor coeruleus TaxID=5963 RepID=A0A1R2BZ17_9CILI|nr:hypothetical protein SteCoe_17434 [Stentor coeruleus]